MTHDTDIVHQAYLKGKAAHAQGRSKEANPHSRKRATWSAWNEGYERADYDAKIAAVKARHANP